MLRRGTARILFEVYHLKHMGGDKIEFMRMLKHTHRQEKNARETILKHIHVKYELRTHAQSKRVSVDTCQGGAGLPEKNTERENRV
jgi:hypothetical protein